MAGEQILEAEAQEQRRAYYRRWRAEHKEAVRQYNARYWQRRAERAAEKRKEGADIE